MTSTVDPGALKRIGAAYYPYRMGLLSDVDRAALKAGKGEALLARATSLLYAPGSMADARLVAHDPFLLMPAFLSSLPIPQSRLDAFDGVLSVRDNNITYVLVSAELAQDPYSMKFQKTFADTIAGAMASMKAAVPRLTLLRTGAIFYAHDSAQEAMDETSVIGFASVVGTLALIFFVFHGLRPIGLGLLAISIGVLCAFLGTLLIFGKIHVIALLLGVSLIGISVDYSLQYFCEYFDAGAADRSARLRRVLPGVTIGLATTLIGYCTLLLAPFPGLRQVAAFSLIGLSSSCLTVVLWFPLLDSNRPPRPGTRLLRLCSFHWKLWQAPALQRVRILIVSVCCLAAFAGLFKFTVDDDVHHLQSLSPQLKQQEDDVERLTGSAVGSQFLLVRGRSEEAVLETEEALSARLADARSREALDGYTALSQFVPSVARQKENRALVHQQLVMPYLSQYLRQVGYRGSVDFTDPPDFLTPAKMPATGPLAMLKTLDISSGSSPAHVVLLRGVKDPGRRPGGDRWDPGRAACKPSR